MKDNEVFTLEEYAKLRTITTTNISWLLASGWIFYFVSLLLNLVYYRIHPSSPKLCTWGALEELEVWSPEEKDTPKDTDHSISGQENIRLDEEAPPIEMAKLLPARREQTCEKCRECQQYPSDTWYNVDIALDTRIF